MHINIEKTLQHAASFLVAFDNPRLEAEVLLSGVLNENRTWLKTHGENKLAPWQWLKFRRFLWQRAQHRPVAYILGYKDWYGQRFKVNSAVLIPRSETETLLHHILEDDLKPQTILDLGTGSGCLAIELKRAHPQAIVTGLDVSKSALKVATSNAREHEQAVEFRHSDMFEAIESGGSFDLIVANLPYVPTATSVTKDIGFEPAGAIFSGVDGLDHYRELLQQLNKKCVQFKQLWLEFLPEQKEAIAQLFAAYKTDFYGDVAGNIFFVRIG